VVIACIAIRLAFELFCLVVVIAGVAFRGGSSRVVPRFRVWIKSSVFLPLLALSADTRASFLDDMVLSDPPPIDYIWLLCTTGVFVAGAKLFADLYFLLHVAQTGLVWSNWVSLVRGAVTAPLLVVRATLSWRKLWYQRLEEHYAERAESGWNEEFAAENMATGGIDGGELDHTDAGESDHVEGSDAAAATGTGSDHGAASGAVAAEPGVQQIEMSMLFGFRVETGDSSSN
jgi:hypothetical protein